MSDTKSKLIQGTMNILGVDQKAAAEMIRSLPFAKYVEAFAAMRDGETQRLANLFGVVTEEPSVNNIKPVADITAGQVPPVEPPAPAGTQPPAPPAFKQGEKLVITTPNGESEADFNRLLPNGQIEVKMDNQIQKINPDDENFTIAQQTDEMTSSGCVAVGAVAPAKDQKVPHIYSRKSK